MVLERETKASLGKFLPNILRTLNSLVKVMKALEAFVEVDNGFRVSAEKGHFGGGMEADWHEEAGMSEAPGRWFLYCRSESETGERDVGPLPDGVCGCLGDDAFFQGRNRMRRRAYAGGPQCINA